MAETFITQCPHCGTSFRITDEHLAVANGSVRCGACLQVFSARNHLLGGNNKARPKPAQSQRPPEPADDDIRFDEEPGDDFEEFLFEDNDDLLADDQDDDLDELSEAFWDLSDDSPRPTPRAQDSARPKRAEPEPSGPEERAFNIEPDNLEDDEQPAWTFDDDDSDDEPEAAETAGNRAAQLAQQLNEASPELDFSEPKGPSGRRWLGGLAIALLLVALAGQLAWWQKDQYARLEPWRGLYQSACDLLGCTLPPQEDLAQIRPSNVVVRNHPAMTEVKLLDAILTNQAPFRQPFPTLVLEYTDINGELVADQAFAPGEYLRGELTGIRLMPTSTRIYVSIPFSDPGEAAVNYQLRTAPAPG